MLLKLGSDEATTVTALGCSARPQNELRREIV
jgi:hypothetical protein